MLRYGKETIAGRCGRKFQLPVLLGNSNSGERTPSKAPIGRIIVTSKRSLTEDLAVEEEAVLVTHVNSQTSRELFGVECSQSIAQN